MVIDVITGFLGAGKTTFLYGYGAYCKRQGERVLVIENEFGMAGIDGALLKGQSLEVVEIAGGCVCCTQKANLIMFMCDAAKHGYDRVILEPSGIYNLDTLFDVLRNPAVQEVCTLGSIITILKPDGLDNLNDRYANIFLSQFLSTGALVISNTQSVSDETVAKCLRKVDIFTKSHQVQFNLDDIAVYTQPWDTFTDDDYAEIMKAGRTHCTHKLITEIHGDIIENDFMIVRLQSVDQIEPLLDYIWTQGASEMIRVKGFLSVQGEKYSVNCTQNCRTIAPATHKHDIINLLGYGLQGDAIRAEIARLQQG